MPNPLEVRVTRDWTQVWCDHCDYATSGVDARLPGVQHAKVEPGHKVRTHREYNEEIIAREA